jgi:tetratricopeptide (TPR) repeat protein
LGRKYSGTRQCLFICIAGLIAISFAGCTAFEGIKGTFTARERIKRSNELLANGNYQEAIAENQRVLSMDVKRIPKDQAIFNIALIYAHNENPGKDYHKSLGYFKTLVMDYTDSPLREQAEVWTALIGSIQKSKIKPEKNNNNKRNTDMRVASNLHLLRSQKLFLEGKYQEVLDENSVLLESPGKEPFRDRALFNLGLLYAHHDNPDKDYSKSLSYFTKLINEHPDSPLTVQAAIWQNVLTIIEKAKQVDIEIEQKKKELSR